MKKLLNKSKSNLQIAREVRFADTYFLRLKGLMFDKSMDVDTALFFDEGRCIHTCFMNFSIDAIFVDKNLVVKSIVDNLKPWRLSKIVWNASSVIELPAGTLKASKVEVGDQLYVGD